MSTNSDILKDENKFITQLKNYLTANQSEKALDLFTNNDYDGVINESSSDLIQIISLHLTSNTKNNKRKLFECCEDILNIIAEKCNPSETVLEFLEQADYDDDDIKFCIILKILSKILGKMPDKTKAIDWCTTTIRSYLDSLPMPENEKQILTEKSTFSDMDATTCRLLNVNAAIVTFLEPLVKDAALTNKHTDKIVTLRIYLLNILINLMGHPFCYLQNQCLKLFKHDLPLPEKIITLMLLINGDLLRFLHIIILRSDNRNGRAETYENEQVMLLEARGSIPDMSYANLYYHIVTCTSLWAKVPQVYDLQYVFRANVYLAKCFLEKQANGLTGKGLHFLTNAIERVEKYSIGPEVLELHVYADLFQTILHVMIYNNNEEVRRKAIFTFKKYIEVFNIEARYLVLTYMYKTTQHSGLLSLIIGIMKNCITECLEKNPPCPCFLGNNLKSLLQLVCKLSHGGNTDLVEITDEVITTLNLLRFLFLRDCANDTSIWSMVEMIDDNYLKPLREGIDLCRAHWKVKLKDLNEQKRVSSERDEKIMIMVAKDKLPPMPIAEKIRFCYQAINGLDVMESVLTRVNECIANKSL